MSRPPVPHQGPPISGEQPAAQRRLDYLPLDHADFVEDALAFAAARGLVFPGGEGDFGRTLIDLSAVLAHVLGVYQDRSATEAFLGTARSPRSLVRHGRRLLYEPDPGVAATGFLHLRVPPGLLGELPEGFAVSSAAVGEKRPQDYETLHALRLDARHNAMRPAGARSPVAVSGLSLRVKGRGHGVAAGDVIVITGAGLLQARVLTSIEESEAADETTFRWSGSALTFTPTPSHRVLARPAWQLRMFGHDAPLDLFSEAALKSGVWNPPTHGTPPADHAGYSVPGHHVEELLLVPEPPGPLLGDVVVRRSGSLLAAHTVSSERSVTAAVRARTHVSTKEAQVGSNGAVTLQTKHVEVKHTHAGPARGLRLSPAQQRAALSPRENTWLAGWALSLPLVLDEPSAQGVSGEVLLDDSFPSLAPGEWVLLCTEEDAVCEVAELLRAVDEPLPSAPSGTATRIAFQLRDAQTPPRAWTKGSLVVRGNVARISHGSAVEEVLGDSDGVTPFLRFELQKSPLTHVPGPQGAEPALEVRVGGVRWRRVDDFHRSGPDDRHYVIRRDERSHSFVLFGDGRRGAIPPSGKKHVTARYRVGLGPDGNADSRAVHRIKKSHPLVESVSNPRSVRGGAAPADAEQVRHQATRFIRTFDRAVSVRDHADLALRFPGVSRASATWGELDAVNAPGVEGIRLVAATAEGAALGDDEALRAFLDGRRDETIPLRLVPPEAVAVKLSLTLEVHADHLPERVKLAVRAALTGDAEDAPGLFTFAGRQLGQPEFLSVLYERLTRVEGVSYVGVSAFHLGSAVAVNDVLRIAPHQWLHLSPAHLIFESVT